MLLNTTNTTPEEIAQEKLLVQETKTHQLILFNDDVNTFDHVIECLMSICGHTELQAEQCAYIVHYKGKCVVKEGDLETMVSMCTHLLHEQLNAEVN
ncbi:MAG: ATP-dependent Clp protease adaptor ClpS [Luteibaculum sp.]